MIKNVKALATLIATLATLLGGLVLAGPAQAASRDGSCDSGEFCYYYNSDNAGSISDFAASEDDYGTTQPSCYDFKGDGNGKGQCIKNNAASVWNRTGKTVTVFFNSGFAGASQSFAAGAKTNLNATLKNNNASHQIGGSTGGDSCTYRGNNPNTCAEAVTWAKNHLGTSSSAYYRACDHYVGVAYGWGNSGSETAYIHWTQVPSSLKHAGDRTVPAGGLAFFKNSGAGHVMISLGNGYFASTDTGSDGTYQANGYNRTTLAKVESSFGVTYLGWTQPWFNH